MRDQKPATEGDCIFFLRGKKRMNAKYSFTTRLIRQLRLALRFPPLYFPVSSFPSRETDIEDDGEEGGNFPESLRRRMRPLGAVGETPKRGTFQRGFVLLTFLLSSKRRLVRTSPETDIHHLLPREEEFLSHVYASKVLFSETRRVLLMNEVPFAPLPQRRTWKDKRELKQLRRRRQLGREKD